MLNKIIKLFWSSTRIGEKLNPLTPETLPDRVTSSLRPDTTAPGQIFGYTFERRYKKGNPVGGWDPHEIRTIQNFYISIFIFLQMKYRSSFYRVICKRNPGRIVFIS